MIGSRLGASGPERVSVNAVTIEGAKSGVLAFSGRTDVRGALISHAAVGLAASDAASLTAAHCTLSGSAVAAQANAGGTLRLSDCDLWDNAAGLDARAGGKLATDGHNRVEGSKTPGAPTPALPARDGLDRF